MPGKKKAIFYEKFEIFYQALIDKCCHGNTLGYCQLKTVSNDALHNYTKSQKVSSTYCEPFWHSKAKTCKGVCAPPA